MIRKLLFISILMLLFGNVSSQEFLCKVQVLAPKIEGVDQSVFDAMKNSIFEFMNDRKWSELNVTVNERIECTFVVTITAAAQGGDQFKANLNVVLQRPIYGTSYMSLLTNIVDNDINFNYIPFQPMIYSDNTYNDNLTQVLAFYAYFLLGMELDTYAKYEGTPFYQKAQAVAITAQSSNEPGWQAFASQKNRTLMVENFLNQTYQAQRDFLYEYHRNGLDIMSKDVEGGRSEITKTLGYLKTIYDLNPNIYSYQILLEAKRQEIIDIYSEATPSEQIEMINIMTEIDPPNGDKYEAVMK
ncbi:MAG TPA: DUF4835 family protein [Bacteroidales bacterium]